MSKVMQKAINEIELMVDGKRVYVTPGNVFESDKETVAELQRYEACRDLTDEEVALEKMKRDPSAEQKSAPRNPPKAGKSAKPKAKAPEPDDEDDDSEDGDESGDPDVPTVADLRAAGKEFLAVKGDEKEARKDLLTKVSAKYGAEKFSEIEEDSRAAAIADLKTLAEGGEVEFED